MPERVENRELVVKALDDLLSWDELVRSPQLGKFLSYIVLRALDGEGLGIKAYAIAVDVFGRSSDFDPQADPIVRVQARRLRNLLEQYYEGPGALAPVRITLPIGRYMPEFWHSDSPPSEIVPVATAVPVPPVESSFRVSWLALAFVVGVIATLAVVMSTMKPGLSPVNSAAGGLQQPSVTVFEFQNLTGDERRVPVVAGLSIELVTDLQLFEDITVRYAGSGVVAVTGDRPVATDYMLTGIARLGRGTIDYTATLTRTSDGAVVWSKAIAMDQRGSNDTSSLDTISREYSLFLGSSRGPLHKTGHDWAAAQTTSDGAPNAYVCDMLLHRFRDSGADADGQRAATCFDRLADGDKALGWVKAATASLLATFAPKGEADSKNRLAMAQSGLRDALAADPTSGFVWEQQARLMEQLGDEDSARAAYNSSIQLNPANADVLAAFARLLALNGSFDESLPYSNAAVYGSPNAPPWYYCVPTLAALRSSDYALSVQNAVIYASADRVLGPVLAVVAGQKGGDLDIVNRYLPQVLDVPSFRSAGIMKGLSARITDAALLSQLMDGLLQAGVPAAALHAAY